MAKKACAITTHRRDRSKSTTIVNCLISAATRGEQAVAHVDETALADGVDLCAVCADAFLNWLRGGNPDLTRQDGPGGALTQTAVSRWLCTEGPLQPGVNCQTKLTVIELCPTGFRERSPGNRGSRRDNEARQIVKGNGRRLRIRAGRFLLRRGLLRV